MKLVTACSFFLIVFQFIACKPEAGNISSVKDDNTVTKTVLTRYSDTPHYLVNTTENKVVGLIKKVTEIDSDLASRRYTYKIKVGFTTYSGAFRSEFFYVDNIPNKKFQIVWGRKLKRETARQTVERWLKEAGIIEKRQESPGNSWYWWGPVAQN